MPSRSLHQLFYISISSPRNFVYNSFCSLVCSDDRSMSPGCGTSQVTEETVLQDLDKFLTLAEKDMVLSSESARNFEDLKLFSRLVHNQTWTS